MDLSFSVHKLANISENPGKVKIEGLVHLLRYIRENKTFGLKYYADMNDAPVTDLLRQASIKTKNHFMAFSDSIWQKNSGTSRSTGTYIIFYQCGPIDHGTHVPGAVSQSSADSEYNAPCIIGMGLAQFRMLFHEMLKHDPEIVPEGDPLIVLDSKFAMCMDNTGNYTKHTRHVARTIHFVRNEEKCKMHKIDWCEVGL